MLFSLDKVGFRYSDGNVGLSNVSFDIEAGDRVVILGANGSGKSTLLRSLNGLVDPTEGEVRYQGRVLTEQTLKDPAFLVEFRSQVGFVFQDADAQLFNATVAEEVAFGPAQLGLARDEVEERISQTLAFLGISHLADRPPFRLSGGEKRKVAIASVLAMNPQTILLDEPVLGLDPRSQIWLMETLEQLQRVGKTTIVATHSLTSLSRIADRAIILSEDHRLLSSGSLEEALTDRDLLERANLISPDYALS